MKVGYELAKPYFCQKKIVMVSATATKPKEIDVDSLISTAERMGDNDFERFADSIIQIQIKRKIAANPKSAAEIIEELKKDLTSKERKRYKALIIKSRNETISEAEHREILECSDKAEELSIYRVERVLKLAALLKLPFDTVWKQMWFYKKNNGI